MPHRSIVRVNENQRSTQHICILSIILIVLIFIFRKYWYIIFCFFISVLLFILALKIIERRCPFKNDNEIDENNNNVDDNEVIIAVPISDNNDNIEYSGRM